MTWRRINAKVLLLSSLNILASTLEWLMPVSRWSGPARCALTHGSSFTQVLLYWCLIKVCVTPDKAVQSLPYSLTHPLYIKHVSRVTHFTSRYDRNEIYRYPMSRWIAVISGNDKAFCYHGLTWIPVWISNHMSNKLWDEISYPFLIFNGCTVEGWGWISNFIQRVVVEDVIPYVCWD